MNIDYHSCIMSSMSILLFSLLFSDIRYPSLPSPTECSEKKTERQKRSTSTAMGDPNFRNSLCTSWTDQGGNNGCMVSEKDKRNAAGKACNGDPMSLSGICNTPGVCSKRWKIGFGMGNGFNPCDKICGPKYEQGTSLLPGEGFCCIGTCQGKLCYGFT